MNRIFLMGGCPIVYYLFETKQYLVIRQMIEHAAAEIPGSLRSPRGHDEIFYEAVRWGNVDVIKLCLEKQPELIKGVTPMWLGFENHEANAFLLDSGVDVHLRGPENTTLLHWVAASHWKTDDRAVVGSAEILIERSIDINAKDDELKSTALGWAARYGRKPLVEYLLECGAATNLPDDEPWATSLAWAEKKGHTEIAEILRKHGATK